MEFKVLEENQKRIIFELIGASHTLCNALKAELWTSKHVKMATYTIKHPLIGVPTFVLETDGEAKPRKVLTDAISNISKDVEKFKKEFDKAIR